jgi:hypothetical protein
VTSSDHPAVTKAMVDTGRPLVLSGVSQDATAVSVTLSDQISNTPDITHEATAPTPAPGAPPATVAQTWTVTFTAAEVAGLADGTLTARGAYAVGAGTVNGKELSIAKDVVAPGAPDATPGGGTANGTTPTAASPVAPAQLLISTSQVIRAVAIDPVGNTSTVSTFAYTIAGAAGGGGSPAAGAATPGVGQVLSAVAGTSARSLAVSNLTIPRRISVTRLRVQGLRVAMRVPAGTEAIRFALYRARDGKPTGRPLARGSRAPSRPGVYRLVLRDRALVRKLRPGSYVLQVAAGRSASSLGRQSTVAFTVTG